MIRAIRLCFVFVLLAVPAFAQTAAARATLYTEIDTLFADTGSDPITPAQLRQSLKNITASSYNGLTDGVVSSTYLPLAGGTLTGGLILPSSNTTGFRIYNTADESTNYARLIILNGGDDIFRIASVTSGTATARPVEISASTTTNSAKTTINRTTMPYVETTFSGNPTGAGTLFGYSTSGTLAGSTGTQIFFGLSPVYNQSSSAAATDFDINRTETAVGSGEQLLANFRVGGTSKFKVSNAGAVTASGAINKVTLTAPATGSTLTIADGKTLTASNTLTLTATDGSTLAIGAGGTLGTAAYTAASAYATSAQGTKADNVGAVNGLVKSNGSASFSAASAGTDYVVPAGNVATATALATPRAIYGNNFDGSAALTQIIASTYGGTGNGFAKFSGPTTSEKTFTLPDANATLLYSGGDAGTPSALVLTNATSLPAAQVVAGALADGMTATTQTVGDNDTSLATTAFANAAAKATRLGSHASPDTTGGAITWATSAVYEVWTNTTTTYTLPAASGYDGKAVIFYVTGTNAITIDPNSSEVIVRDGTAQTGGVTLTLAGVAGNYVCLICDGTRWISLGYKGVLAAGS